MGVGRPRLIGLLAAHFAASDQARVDRLRRLLTSVEEQTVRVPLLASWSAEEEDGDTSIGAQAKAIFDEFSAAGVVHAMPGIRGRRAQFQHYARLRGALGRHIQPSEKPWVFFSDDDDIWHPRRAEEYMIAMEDEPEVEVAVSRLHISPGLSPKLPPSFSAQDVTRLQKEGSLRLAVAPDQVEPGLFGTAKGEYFDMAVAFNVFDDFFTRHNEALVRNRFADIRFRTCVQKWPGGVYRFLPKGDGVEPGDVDMLPWMYFYDRPIEPYTTPPSEEDLRYVCAELPDVKRIAGMRQTLDCVLFQLTPTQGPLQISKMDFAEQLVGILNEQGPAAVRMAFDRCQIHGIEVS